MKAALLLLSGCVLACSGSTRTTPLSPLGGDSGGDSRTTTDQDDPVDVVPDEDDDDPIIPPPEVDDPTFGDDCDTTAECGPGLVCSGLAVGSTICTVPCIGTGRGGNDDCPTGFACYNYESTTLDGVQICLADWQLGAGEAGYPFTTPPGGACTDSDNECQTQVCDTATGTCVVQCAADRDCGSGEVCYAYPADMGYLHVCIASDLSRYRSTGESCSDPSECDSGMCVGSECVAHCRAAPDCGPSEACGFYPLIDDGGQRGWTSVCIGRLYSGHGDLWDDCDTDSDCAGEWCLEGMCTTPCATRDDCDELMVGTECIQLNFASSDAAFSGGFCLMR
ncbi:MAG TPA: hypothetical protein VLC93_13890 [Myxococcota bacterium]|nr:hypothetical protein [Myxococcota bacterium]